MTLSTTPDTTDRLQAIAHARSAVIADARPEQSGLVAPWIERSWRRCLANGQRPEQRVGFDAIAPQAMRRVTDASRALVRAAQPVLAQLGQALADTRYFAILTDAQGVVVDVNGRIDRSDRRADLITRIGTDLSERTVGTTAISAALIEQQPVWLHRGEHFFADTSVYSCAGAPLFGPDGRCAGMLDLTGIEAVERPELRHLVAQSARHIENTLVLDLPWALLVRINWPGRALGSSDDGLVCLDADGWLLGMNQAAQAMLGPVVLRDALATNAALHANDLFALAHEVLFDAAHMHRPAVDVPLWSGLRLQAMAQARGRAAPQAVTPVSAPRQLKDVEADLIRKAVEDARGNVVQAARALGISRATVYRKLGTRKRF